MNSNSTKCASPYYLYESETELYSMKIKSWKDELYYSWLSAHWDANLDDLSDGDLIIRIQEIMQSMYPGNYTVVMADARNTTPALKFNTKNDELMFILKYGK